jgi:hypothetical protein
MARLRAVGIGLGTRTPPRHRPLPLASFPPGFATAEPACFDAGCRVASNIGVSILVPFGPAMVTPMSLMAFT